MFVRSLTFTFAALLISSAVPAQKNSAPVTPPDSASPAQQQDLWRLSGFVRSAASGEVIRHAQLAVDGLVRRETNVEGFFSLSLAAGVHRLRVRGIGFAPVDTTVDLAADAVRDFSLAIQQYRLATVAVKATSVDRPDLDPFTPDMSVVRLDLKAVKMAPLMLGESDPIRSLALLPGVSLSSDASTAFSVRGGQADQNLILLDESTIYNPSHVLGILSTFNTDAVDDVTLYKGAIPSKFGGRLASVVDVRQREGNAIAFHGAASIGLLASRLLLEGPLPAKHGSYMIAARRSYADVFLGLAKDTAVRNNTVYFYDLNAKGNVRIGATGMLMASGYLGRDQFTIPGLFGAGWGNKAATLRWNQAFGGRLFSKVTSAWADYSYRLAFAIVTRDSLRWTAGISSNDFKIDEQLHLKRAGVLEFGAQLTAQEFRPGTIMPTGAQSLIQGRVGESRFARTSALYLGHEVDLGSRVSVRYGARYAGFQRLGRATILKYANDAPIVYNDALGRYDTGLVVDSTIYARGRSIRTYGGLEPRFSARVLLDQRTSVKLSYSRTQQFLQLVTNTNSPAPFDVWEPAGAFIRPQVGDQVAAGVSATRGAYEMSAEVYVRKATDLVDYVDGAEVVFNRHLETILVQGEGRAVGLELLARRMTGRLTGWASYTLGKAEQRFPAPRNAGAAPGGGINGGRWYLSPFDKRHNLSIVAVYQLKPKWTMGSTFALASGLPITLPVSRYQVDGLLLTEFGERNSSRLPLYHRLDISFTRALKNGELQFGVLNAYNHFNAQALHVRQQDTNPLVTEAVQTSVFGVVPSISYTFRF